ncbi:MAG: MoaD/ThiS family protein [Candidatus Thorarchaeota archaeon]
MIVEVLYFAEFRDITGRERETFEISNSHLLEVVQILSKKYGFRIQNLIWDENVQKIHNVISIVINNQPIHEKDASIINLSDGDTIAFLMPVSGG